jgi:hypothetical protein
MLRPFRLCALSFLFISFCPTRSFTHLESNTYALSEKGCSINSTRINNLRALG